MWLCFSKPRCVQSLVQTFGKHISRSKTINKPDAHSWHASNRASVIEGDVRMPHLPNRTSFSKGRVVSSVARHTQRSHSPDRTPILEWHLHFLVARETSTWRSSQRSFVARGVHEFAVADLLFDEYASPQFNLDHPCAIPAAVVLCQHPLRVTVCRRGRS
jgi:hypothetical protein